jgi:hypothetical protein
VIVEVGWMAQASTSVTGKGTSMLHSVTINSSPGWTCGGRV